MNIYEFINSKDIREHCKKLDYQFNTLESAYLVWQSKKTFSEKHRAYWEIIDTMPDMEFKRNNCMTINYSSLHEFLKKYMKYENDLFEVFKAEDDAIYLLGSSMYEYSEDDMYENWKACFDKHADIYGKEDITYRIAKKWAKTAKNEKEKEIIAYFFSNRALLELHNMGSTREEADIEEAFTTLWLEIPTPFVKGDIVYEPDGFTTKFPPTGEPFVLTSLCTWGTEEWLGKQRHHADNSDMTAYGYFYTKGRPDVYSECMHNYLNLEYYTGRLKGRQKLLKAISSFLKDDIDIALLVNAYMIINYEEDARYYRKYLNYTNEGLMLAGLNADIY